MEQIKGDVIRWLSYQDNSAWMIIFDNLDREPTDPGGFDLWPYLPQRDHGSIRITTRLAPFGKLGCDIKVGRMTVGESTSLLGNCAGSSFTRSRSTAELLDALDGLPLAISQAGRLIKYLNMTPESYVQMYGSERREVMELMGGGASRGSIRTTWNTTLDLLKERIS